MDLGPAFAESVYENALSRELMIRGVVFERQVVVPVHYKDGWVGEGRMDMVIAGVLVVELKALPEIATVQSGIRRVVRTR